MALVMGAAAAWAALPFGADESWTRMAESLWYSTDGVFGRPVEVVGRIVLVYIAFGAVLQASGAGAVLLRLAFAATARAWPAGPAHAAIVGSALFGTLSGAAVANVVSTGVFTIPVIKRAGFPPRFAGAVEAAASTGGQITPPVMGVVAFLMADLTGAALPHRGARRDDPRGAVLRRAVPRRAGRGTPARHPRDLRPPSASRPRAATRCARSPSWCPWAPSSGSSWRAAPRSTRASTLC